jgi:recombinational DNA repair protein (RecF pathway)
MPLIQNSYGDDIQICSKCKLPLEKFRTQYNINRSVCQRCQMANNRLQGKKYRLKHLQKKK